ncbi:PAS domain-containing protein [Streptomyces sp. NBC_01238]|uniref:PAS domain-containing protein n=1 Tax=Streptomyces sp. NBC_01238 TaxID=2903791 RepID=UPI00386F48ED
MHRPEVFDQAADAAEVRLGGLWPNELLVAGVRVDALGRIVHWDAAAEALLGYPASEVLGSRGELLIPAEGRSAAWSLLERVAAGRATTGPCTARHRDRHLMELAVWAYQVPEPPGAGGDVLVFLVDVSAALEMRVSRAVLDGLFSRSPIGLCVFDSELRYLRVNTALEAINGVTEAGHLGRRLSEVLPGVNSAEVETVMQRVLDTGESAVDFRATGRTPATPYEDRAWSCSYFRLQDTRGRPCGVGASVVDVTARDRADTLAESLTGRFEEHHAFMCRMLLDTVDYLTVQIDKLTARITLRLAGLSTTEDDQGPGQGTLIPITDTERLDEIPGIGPNTAQVILAETGLDMSVFPTAGHLVSWAKLSPRTIQSDGKNTSGPTGKGNPWLRGALGEAAISAARTDTFLGARYRRIAKRRGHMKALVAVARSILVAVWHLMNNPTARYRDLGADFHTRNLDPTRKTRDLVRQLAALGHDVPLAPAAA